MVMKTFERPSSETVRMSVVEMVPPGVSVGGAGLAWCGGGDYLGGTPIA
jgi:hypothetical protein